MPELEEFWQTLGPRPLGHVASGFLEGFWRNPTSNIRLDFAMPALRFGHGQELSEVPEWSSADKYRAHYNQRLEYLARLRMLLELPPALGRALYTRCPARLGEDAPRELAEPYYEQARDLDQVNLHGRTHTVHYGARGNQRVAQL